MPDSIYELWREAVNDHRPVALATIIEGENLGAKLIVGDGIDSQGTLGDLDLDRVGVFVITVRMVKPVRMRYRSSSNPLLRPRIC